MIKIISYNWMYITNMPFVGKVVKAQSFLGLPLIIFSKMEYSNDVKLINHEMIHFWQALWLGFVPFWIIYAGHYFVNLAKGMNGRDAYRNIVFEKEAYENDDNLEYLFFRKPYAWTKYFTP